jgi:Tol biopolymer transport system component
MDSKLRDRLEDLAREIPVASSMPASLPRRARRRAILTLSSVVLCGTLVAVGAVAGLRSILRSDDHGAFTQPTPTPTVDRGRWGGIAGWITYTDEQRRPAAVDPDTSATEVIPLDEDRTIVAWSHDGSRVLLSSTETGDFFVEDGQGNSWQVGSGFYPGGGGSWSPDDTMVVYAELGNPSNKAAGAIWIADAQGERLPRVIRQDDSGGRAFFAPAWSPDGTQIAFLEINERASGATLMIMNTDGSEAHPLLTETTVGTWAPAWSPDGSTIAFTGAEGAESGVYTVQRDGTGVTKVADVPGASSVAWSSDGTSLAFRVMPDDQLYVVDAAGGSARPLGVFAFKDTSVQWVSEGGTP